MATNCRVAARQRLWSPCSVIQAWGRTQVSDTVEALLGMRERMSAGFSVRRIPFSQAAQWSLAEGALRHRSSGFFDFIGAGCRRTGATGLYLYQPSQGLNGLLVTAFAGETHLLLHPRIEPGNLGVVQFSPTVQATPGNYLRRHGGQAPLYVDYFFSRHADAVPLADGGHADLGERYFMKNKRFSIVAVSEPPAAADGYVWAPLSVICRMARLGETLNNDLRSMLAVMPWTDLPAGAPGNALAAALHAGLAAPLRPDVLGAVMAAVARQAASAPILDHMIPLQELPGWEITDDALIERTGEQGFEVHCFAVNAPGREVEQWEQPLIHSRCRGRQDLCLRIQDGALEVLVRVGQECGLAGGAALFPTILRYPGSARCSAQQNAIDAIAGSTVLLQTVESDEGGRFYRDASDCRLLLLAEDVEFGADFMWLSVAELKFFLERSGMCAIQLRVMASMLLGLL